jgi:hypothetical protein
MLDIHFQSRLRRKKGAGLHTFLQFFAFIFLSNIVETDETKKEELKKNFCALDFYSSSHAFKSKTVFFASRKISTNLPSYSY